MESVHLVNSKDDSDNSWKQTIKSALLSCFGCCPELLIKSTYVNKHY